MFLFMNMVSFTATPHLGNYTIMNNANLTLLDFGLHQNF